MPVELNRAPRVPTGAEPTLRSVEIEFTDNGGAIVRCRPMPPKAKDGGETPMAYQEPGSAAFEDVDSAFAYARKKAGVVGSEGGESEGDE